MTLETCSASDQGCNQGWDISHSISEMSARKAHIQLWIPCKMSTRESSGNGAVDKMVNWPNASLRDPAELPDIWETPFGIVREDPLEAAFSQPDLQDTSGIATSDDQHLNGHLSYQSGPDSQMHANSFQSQPQQQQPIHEQQMQPPLHQQAPPAQSLPSQSQQAASFSSPAEPAEPGIPAQAQQQRSLQTAAEHQTAMPQHMQEDRKFIASQGIPLELSSQA